MKIAVIGTGNMGSGLAATLAAAKHEVVIGSRNLAKSAALAEKIGQGVQGAGIAAAVKLAEVVILAVPFGSVADVLNDAGDVAGKVLVDITNPISADFKSLVIGHTTSAAEEIQSLAPAAKVVKAFNTIFAQLIAPEGRNGQALQVFVAGDDVQAKEAVSALVKSAGFEPIDAGPLSNARFIEPVGEMNIHFGYFLGWGPATAPSWVRV